MEDSYDWDDSSDDVFEREPYIVRFKSPTTSKYVPKMQKKKKKKDQDHQLV